MNNGFVIESADYDLINYFTFNIYEWLMWMIEPKQADGDIIG